MSHARTRARWAGVAAVLAFGLSQGWTVPTAGAAETSQETDWTALSCAELDKRLPGGCAKHLYPQFMPITDLGASPRTFIRSLKTAKDVKGQFTACRKCRGGFSKGEQEQFRAWTVKIDAAIAKMESILPVVNAQIELLDRWKSLNEKVDALSKEKWSSSDALEKALGTVREDIQKFETDGRQFENTHGARHPELRQFLTALKPPIADTVKRAGESDSHALSLRAAESQVVGQIPGFVAADVWSVEKVKQAFLTVPADKWMTAHKTISMAKGQNPADRGGKQVLVAADWWLVGHEGATRFRVLSRKERQIESGVPALLWNADPTGGTFVFADGRVWKGPLNAMRSSFPPNKPVVAIPEGLEIQEVELLEKAGALASGTAETFKKAFDEADACRSRIWTAADKEFRAIETANTTESTRRNRYDDLTRRIDERVKKACGSQANKVEKLLIGVTGKWNAAREDLAKAVSKRIGDEHAKAR